MDENDNFLKSHEPRREKLGFGWKWENIPKLRKDDDDLLFLNFWDILNVLYSKLEDYEWNLHNSETFLNVFGI